MSYRFIYDSVERARLIPSVLIDKRAAIPVIANQVGTVIKAYTDAAVAVTDNVRVIVYKIETEDGNLAGYWTLSVKFAGASLLSMELRPAHEQFAATISGLINNFISAGTWKADSLYAT